jgi:SpoVK/Ycf46/Vps4 family AAA+-type ATPase
MMKKEYFANSIEHLVSELERLDLLIQLQVRRSRLLQQQDSEFQGLYISEKEIDDLLIRQTGLPRWAIYPDSGSDEVIRMAIERIQKKIEAHKNRSIGRGVNLRLEDLANTFQLTPFDIDILIICLAPEIDLRYERLYAYLHDDVTKKRPSVDLVLNLLSSSFEVKLAARKYFAASAPLSKYFLIHLFDDPARLSPPLLGKYLKINERIVNYLHDSDEIDSHLLPYVSKKGPQFQLKDLILPEDLKRRLALLIKGQANAGRRLILYFQGPYGVARHSTAGALCHKLGLNLLTVNLEKLLEVEGSNFEKAVRLVGREALLQKAALYFRNFDILVADANRSFLDVFLCELELRPELTFLAGQTTWEPADALHDIPFVRIEFPPPVYADRVQLWTLSLNGHESSGTDVNLEALANKFRFSGGQIRDAAATAGNLARWRNPAKVQVSMTDLYTASRLQSNRKLTSLAQKITPQYRWNDIVLPDDRLQQMQEICNCVKYRALVYEEWGFDRKLSLGKGLNILFAGPSGTGKTMAAEIMAAELGLDLYKIDLSTVVSKYIGETEKNLSRIFAEAQTSNAILFFDEADALFGKRSEVRDAHDRYANIEISYLLQKMEEYEGVVILATNLRKNMDDSFVRRIHFSVEFPFPAEKYRRRIWEGIWPDDIPMSPELDLDFLARRFEIAGGNIRNIALAAAFLAADDGKVIDIAHVIRATQREYQKVGKLSVGEDFGEYHHLLKIEV